VFIAQLKVKRDAKTYTYHRLMESVRTPKGPRQRLIMSLGTLSIPKAQWPVLAERIQDFLTHQRVIPYGSTEVDHLALRYAQRVRHKQLRQSARAIPRGQTKQIYVEESATEQIRELGPEYVAHAFWQQLHLDRILKGVGFSAKQCRLAEVQVIGRLVAPRSELGTVSWFGRTALNELMQPSLQSLTEDQLYRISDRLYRNRSDIEAQLADRERELFGLAETIVLYDLTSTYFEGLAAANPLARHGHSRDHRGDCKQVVVGMVLDEDGFPKAHEVFSGNTRDSQTFTDMLDRLKARVANRQVTVVVDRGLSSDENLALLRQRGYHYIVTTRQSQRSDVFDHIDPEQFVPVRHDSDGTVSVAAQLRRVGDEVLVLCHSQRRAAKDRAIRDRFTTRFEEDAARLARRVAGGRLKNPEKINQAIGRLKERYPRVARHYELQLRTDATGKPAVEWDRHKQTDAATDELDGTYLIRTDRSDLSQQEIWKLYVMLSRVERSFRYLKSDLGLRPVFHQKGPRVEGHIFISVLAYHLLHAIERRLTEHSDQRTWPTIRDLLSTHQMATIVHRCTDETVMRLRVCSTVEANQAEVYQRLGLPVPELKRRLQT
jgi:transposase